MLIASLSGGLDNANASANTGAAIELYGVVLGRSAQIAVAVLAITTIVLVAGYWWMGPSLVRLAYIDDRRQEPLDPARSHARAGT